jgi:hypothetical protein
MEDPTRDPDNSHRLTSGTSDAVQSPESRLVPDCADTLITGAVRSEMSFVYQHPVTRSKLPVSLPFHFPLLDENPMGESQRAVRSETALADKRLNSGFGSSLGCQ